MLTVKVEKCEHGGYIAKQEGDTPLRYIAAAGDTEAAAVAALFDYHADLIRKDRIDMSQVKTGVRPGGYHKGALKFDLDRYPPDMVPKSMWDYLMPMVKGEKQLPFNGEIDNLICRVVKRCFIASEPSKRLCWTGESFNWSKLAISVRNQPPHTSRWFKTEDDVAEGSEALARMSARVLWILRRDMGPRNIRYVESEIVDFIECCIKAFGEQGIEFNACVLPNQYLLSMLDLDCIDK